MTRASSTHAKGQRAETAAAHWLVDRGYALLGRNVRNHAGEIDLVVRDDDTLCFVEVKARESQACGAGLEAVTAHRQRRLVRAAALEIARVGWSGPCRFDVLGMEPGPEGWRFHHVRDAFDG